MNIDDAKQTVTKWEEYLKNLIENFKVFDRCRIFESPFIVGIKYEISCSIRNDSVKSERNIIEILKSYIKESGVTNKTWLFLKQQNDLEAYEELNKIINSINSYLNALKLQTNNSERFKELNRLCNEALLNNDLARNNSEIHRIISDISYGEITTKICAVNSIHQGMITVEIIELLINELMLNVSSHISDTQMEIKIEYLFFIIKKIKELSEKNNLLKEKIISKIYYCLENDLYKSLLVLVRSVILTEKEKIDIAEKIIDNEFDKSIHQVKYHVVYEIIYQLGLNKFTNKIMDYLIRSCFGHSEDSCEDRDKNILRILRGYEIISNDVKDISQLSSYYLMNKFRDVILKSFE